MFLWAAAQMVWENIEKNLLSLERVHTFPGGFGKNFGKKAESVSKVTPRSVSQAGLRETLESVLMKLGQSLKFLIGHFTILVREGFGDC